MLIRMKDLMSLRMVASDGSHHAVLDLFVDGRGMRVTHVASRLGSWFANRQCVLRVSAFGAPDPEAGLWPVAVERSDVERAPAPGETARGEDARGSEVGDSPAALLASEGAEVGPNALGAAECEAAGAGEGAVHSLAGLLGAPLEAPDRRAGTVMDAVVETDDWSVAMLVVHAGEHEVEHQRVVPQGMVERIDWDGPRVVLRCGAASVDESPDLHEIGDRLHGRWFNQVLAYYGLG